ncbi:MAG: O-antigen ligase family protein [Actinomycetota bacterium]
MISLNEQQSNLVRRLTLLAGLATTLIVWPPLADPINFPKMFILLLITAWVFGTVVVGLGAAKNFKFSIGQWTLILFAICVLIAAFLTPVHYTAFFGANHRNDGALSYIALAFLALAATLSFKTAHALQVRNLMLVLGAFLAFYGYLQNGKHDPFHWVLLYSPVIGTLGNPDFMSALMGTTAIAAVWYSLKTKNWWLKGVGVLLVLVQLYVIQKSGSSQGLLGFGAGLALLIVVKLWQLHRGAGIVAFVLAAIGSGVVSLGIINKGPFAEHIYQASLRNRQDYWHGALGMFKSNPFRGIGIDRFGEFYPQFAPQVQVVQNQGTDNAHSVFMQILATGGLLVFIPYILIVLVVLYTGIRGFFKTEGNTQFEIAGIFALWFSLLLVSIISIDNLGVAVWFWILGGVLYGVARKQIAVHEHQPIGKADGVKIQGGKSAKSGKNSKGGKSAGRSAKKRRSTSDSTSSIAALVSICLVIVTAAIVAPLWAGQNAIATLQKQYNKLPRELYITNLKDVANKKPVNIQTLITVADIAMKMPEPGVALDMAKTVLEKDPRNLSGLNMAAYANDIQKNFAQAIPYREKLVEYQPWITKNMTDLVHDYMVTGQKDKAVALAAKIAKLAPDSGDAKMAATLTKE